LLRWRLVRLGGARQRTDDRFGPSAHPGLARNGVHAAAVGRDERGPALRITDAALDLVDQPVQCTVAAVADEVGDPRRELLDGAVELLDRVGLVHFAAGADDATQCGDAVLGSGAILPRIRIDDDAYIHPAIPQACPTKCRPINRSGGISLGIPGTIPARPSGPVPLPPPQV